MSAMLSQQSGLYVDTADQLVQLVRSTLVNAWYAIIRHSEPPQAQISVQTVSLLRPRSQSRLQFKHSSSLHPHSPGFSGWTSTIWDRLFFPPTQCSQFQPCPCPGCTDHGVLPSSPHMHPGPHHPPPSPWRGGEGAGTHTPQLRHQTKAVQGDSA